MKTIIHILMTLTVVGVLSGGLLSKVSEWADPKIAKHRAEETKQAIFEVKPDAETYEKVESVNYEAYKVFNKAGEFTGYALPIEGNGFQGKIRLMIGANKELNKVTGMKVLEQVETPGLGTKVVVDPSNKEEEYWFSNQFKELNAHPQIDVVKNQKPSKDNQIQAVTGATITSKAIADIINKGLANFKKDAGQEVSSNGK